MRQTFFFCSQKFVAACNLSAAKHIRAFFKNIYIFSLLLNVGSKGKDGEEISSLLSQLDFVETHEMTTPSFSMSAHQKATCTVGFFPIHPTGIHACERL